MNISNLIIRLQGLANNSTDTFELMVLSKIIEKMRVGAVNVVSQFSDLPSFPPNEDGELYLVEADEELYYNFSNRWISFKASKNTSAMAWGANSSGQLGDNTASSRLTPVSIVGGITNWFQLSAGGDHSLGLTKDGGFYAWGLNSSGQLGDGTTTNRSSPVTVIGGITNWRQVSAGFAHSLGVTDTGIAYAWGNNSYSRLGDGTTTNRSSPVTVVGGITNWRQVSAGTSHSLGLTDTGIAYAWGNNGQGRLGDGTIISKSSPVPVIGGITNWRQLSAAGGAVGFHSLGLTDTGIAYAWGNNGQGRLGDGTETSRSSPVTVIGGITNWSSLSAGESHSLGVTDTGIAYAWGFNLFGKLGVGDTTSRLSPVTVVGGITNWSSLSAGEDHSLGVTDTGIAYAWGSNVGGLLGDFGGTSRSSPVTVFGGIASWTQVSAGAKHSLGIKAN